MKRRLARFWYKFKNWFRTKPGPGEPLTFLCGSKAELVRLTRLVCCINPRSFHVTQKLEISYEHFPGHGVAIFIDDGFCPRQTAVDRLLDLLFLVLYHNKFEGTYWVYQVLRPDWHAIDRRGCHIDIDVFAPSAHERAEALLALSEWLDGKVSEQEKRELLQLPDDAEI